MKGSAPVLDVVVPVHNEQATVAACVQRLDAHLHETFPYPYRITIADNASTDATWAIARSLACRAGTVRAVRLSAKGRGRALKAVWSTSDAAILAYLDVDLSTDLDALYPLVAPLLSGHSDLAIGSRLARGARVVRGPYREFVSRGYNAILHATLGARFSDAQCGFKAIRADVAAELLPYVEDPTWFFDTELLVLAERCGLRIHEVPVDWYDDPDSRVDVTGTAMDDLRGVRRMRRAFARGAIPVDAIASRIGRGRLLGGAAGEAARFAVVGAVSTALHWAGFLLLLTAGLTAQFANLMALSVATVYNTAANRSWTFGAVGKAGAVRNQVQGILVFALTWLLTAATLGFLGVVSPDAGPGVSTVAVALAGAMATVAKFGAFRRWMSPAADPALEGSASPEAEDEAGAAAGAVQAAASR